MVCSLEPGNREDGLQVREVKAHPGWAVGITFIGALFLGMLVGLGLMTVLCRRRMRAARHQAQYPDSAPPSTFSF